MLTRTSQEAQGIPIVTGSPLPGLIKVERNWITRIGMCVVGPRMFKKYPYEELCFLEWAKRVRDRIKRAGPCYIGGVCILESLDTVMREFDFVEIGRALLKDPAFVNHAMADPNYVNGCDHCN